jgi:hypothetical protein
VFQKALCEALRKRLILRVQKPAATMFQKQMFLARREQSSAAVHRSPRMHGDESVIVASTPDQCSVFVKLISRNYWGQQQCSASFISLLWLLIVAALIYLFKSSHKSLEVLKLHQR